MGIFTSDSDRITRNYFDSLLIETRYIDSAVPDSSMGLFGETFRTPVMTAALSHLDGTAQGGMYTYAKGAEIAGALHWVGMGSPAELERIIDTGAKTVKIVKPMENEDAIFMELEHAEKSGCIAVGMDIDHAFSSDGKCDNVMGIPMKPVSMEALKKYIGSVNIPFIIKGVTSPADAIKARSAGAAGLVVSHHHGMVGYSVPPLMVLPEIIKATEGSIPIFADCGFESGMDIYKALALGAKEVSVGRYLMPLLHEGPDAVAAKIKEMDAELRGVMARTGVKDLSSFDPAVIHHTFF